MTKYTLQPYTTPASRHHCPSCNDRRKTFKRYIDTRTGHQLADHVGRCDRENSCGYHYTPRQYFEAEGGGTMVHRPSSTAKPGRRVWSPKKNHGPSTKDHGQKSFSHDLVTATLRRYKRNNLVQYLIKIFGAELTKKLVCHYYIGTAKHWPGTTIFWQMDMHDQVRTGKVMLYDAATGKRVKKPFSHITWAHSLLGRKNGLSDLRGLSDFRTPIKQCLFGEHLLKDYPQMPVAIVESEKTAIIAAGYNHSYIWLACGSISNLNLKMCKALKGRHVTLYPDLGAYDKWLAKARVLQRELKRTSIHVSNVLELNATDEQRKLGLDIADVLG